MDGEGGCCIARCGVGGAAYDTSKIGRIMLRFRPIAPKPATSGADSGGDKAPDGHSRFQKTGRGRRKNTAAKNINKGGSSSGSDGKKRKLDAPCLDNLSSMGEGVPNNTVVTLKTPVWLSFDGKNNGEEGEDHCVYPSVRENIGMWPRQQREVVRSWVIVESVMDTWMEAEGMVSGRTDEEKKTILEDDTCPCLVSDGWNRVLWTNKAYRKMASGGGRREALGTTSLKEDAEVAVWVVMKEKVPVACQAFTCRVRVQSEGGSMVTSPCDVWRMSGGGFAWRLDVKAALSLGR